MVSQSVSISVVIPSFQACRHISSLLQALLAQRTEIEFEIVVVDSSTDGTDRLVATKFPQVRLIHRDERCRVGAARNIGIEAAVADKILFADTDTVPCPTWLDQMSRALDSADAVGGSIANGTPWSWTGSAGFYLEFFRFLEHDADPHPARYLVGANTGVRRSALGGMRYEDHAAGEDFLVSTRLADQRKEVIFLPRAAMRHTNRTGLMNVLRYQQKLGEGAYVYRAAASPEKLRVFRMFPALVFLAPPAVMVWIGATILKRRRWADLLRFCWCLPVCLVGNLFWAAGFYSALRKNQ